MKKISPRLLLLFVVPLLLQSCVKDNLKSTYTYFAPVYKSKAEVWQSVKSAAPQALQRTGKLFILGKYIFINEVNKGVHIIDNTNPRTPENLAFISIPGNLDIAVKNHTLYADLYTDMLTIDITDPHSILLKKVTDKVFPDRAYDNNFSADSTRYIVDWEKKQTSEKSDLGRKVLIQPGDIFFNAAAYSTAAVPVVGVSGSMARFTVVDDYLYTVGRSFLTTFNITSPNEPLIQQVEPLGWNIETIYPLKDKLFIGSQTGMFIYSITDPALPAYLGGFSHACFKDPVIADDHYAYVTLRANGLSVCRDGAAGQRNEMDVVDISNILQPTLVKIYDMTEPKGLSKDGDHLFVCDGKAGLRIFNAADVQHIRQIDIISDINPSDVICQDGLAIVVADEGIYQYDYTNINSVKLLSKISVDKQ